MTTRTNAMVCIRVRGAGPAGSAAAIAGLTQSAAVEIVETSRIPRHKVCGEFLSPDVARLLHRLGAWEDFLRLEPARIGRCVLHFGTRVKRFTLPESAFGLSRYELDRLLFQKVVALGATVAGLEEPHTKNDRDAIPLVVATGRQVAAQRGNRLFGFKAHFDGPLDDAVELFFFDGCYVGVSSVERGATNVCGVAPEGVLRNHDFEMDALLNGWLPLAGRLAPLSRKMDWLTTGPLVFSSPANCVTPGNTYPAGDALGFIDPFTGTGILNALLTGFLAGEAAARRIAPEAHLARCRQALVKPFLISSLFRKALSSGWADGLAHCLPGRWLFRLTRTDRATLV